VARHRGEPLAGPTAPRSLRWAGGRGTRRAAGSLAAARTQDSARWGPAYGRNVLIYHGVLAPHARWRPQVVAYGRPAPPAVASDPARAGRISPSTPRNWSWAALRRRAFALDLLVCPRCGGRLRVIATVGDPAAVRQILTVQRPADPRGPGPPPSPASSARTHW